MQVWKNQSLGPSQDDQSINLYNRKSALQCSYAVQGSGFVYENIYSQESTKDTLISDNAPLLKLCTKFVMHC